jgi:hypothetical protein
MRPPPENQTAPSRERGGEERNRDLLAGEIDEEILRVFDPPPQVFSHHADATVRRLKTDAELLEGHELYELAARRRRR